jgi:hypothetical protein
MSWELSCCNQEGSRQDLHKNGPQRVDQCIQEQGERLKAGSIEKQETDLQCGCGEGGRTGHASVARKIHVNRCLLVVELWKGGSKHPWFMKVPEVSGPPQLSIPPHTSSQCSSAMTGRIERASLFSLSLPQRSNTSSSSLQVEHASTRLGATLDAAVHQTRLPSLLAHLLVKAHQTQRESCRKGRMHTQQKLI